MKKLTKEDRLEFIEKYNIDPAKLRNCKLTLKDAEAILLDYEKTAPQLENVAAFLTTQLQKNDGVHSVRFRIKHNEHLIEKIIRKNSSNPNRNIGIHNYTEEITDLIGIRVLHIFKEEWDDIHNYLLSTFNLKEGESPKVYFKKGDSDTYLEKYVNKGLLTEEHLFGYRSIHYIIRTDATKNPIYAEVQVRTIYEEAWSEIDHRIRYPYNQNHKLFSQILYILNGLSHSADEVGSFINNLKNIVGDFSSQLNEKEVQLKGLIKELDKVKAPAHIKELLRNKFNAISKLDSETKFDVRQILNLIKNLDL